jgi:hypothetical protein
VNLAAAILGWSGRRVRHAIAAGLLRSHGEVHQRVELASIEEVWGKPISAEVFLAADRSRDHARRVQRVYNARRRA